MNFIMKSYNGKIVFITGAAMGIGFSLAKAFAMQGARLMLADIDKEALAKAVVDLRGSGADVASVVCDVTSRDSIEQAAAATIEQYGKVHVVANNAGALTTGRAGNISVEKWDWSIRLNLMSVVHGTEVFLPLIRQHGEGGHILNTASLAGHIGYGLHTPYNASKFGVVGYSEALSAELVDEHIDVTILCPGFVSTNIADNQRHDPTAEPDDNAGNDALKEVVSRGLSPDTVAEFTVEQMQLSALYVFPNSGTRVELVARYQKLIRAFDASDASELIQSDPGSIKQNVNEADLVESQD
jgi:NAD(P)-dependent dehydrogenase (short-subunit alcohol dehydrogenase family)